MYKIEIHIDYDRNGLLIVKEGLQTLTKSAIRITGITIGAGAGFSAGMVIGVNSFERGPIPINQLHEYADVPSEVAAKSITHFFNSVGTAICGGIVGGITGYKLSNHLIHRLFG